MIVEMREGDERLPLSFLLRMDLSVRDVRDLLWKRLKVKFRGVRFRSGLAWLSSWVWGYVGSGLARWCNGGSEGHSMRSWAKGVPGSKHMFRTGKYFISYARRSISVLEAVFCPKRALAALERLDQWIQ